MNYPGNENQIDRPAMTEYYFDPSAERAFRAASLELDYRLADTHLAELYPPRTIVIPNEIMVEQIEQAPTVVAAPVASVEAAFENYTVPPIRDESEQQRRVREARQNVYAIYDSMENRQAA